MKEQRKIWMGLGVALVAGCTAAQSADDPASARHTSHQAMQTAAYAGEGEGEGEGGEGARQVDLTTDDAAYLSHLGLVRGHLWVGVQLYLAGHQDMALTHMKHPGDELYAGLKPALDARREEGFARELSALAQAVENKLPREEVLAHHAQLEKAIAGAEDLDQVPLKTVLSSIESMVRTAAEEYAIGVKEGEIVNAHEYQDSYGFVTVARARLQNLTDTQKQQAPETVAQIENYLLGVQDLWPQLLLEGSLMGDASRLHGAAARIQLAIVKI